MKAGYLWQFQSMSISGVGMVAFGLKEITVVGEFVCSIW